MQPAEGHRGAPHARPQDRFMGKEGYRARSHAHSRRRGRFTFHILIVMLAIGSVALAARYPSSSRAANPAVLPAVSLSGLAGGNGTSVQAYFRPGANLQTRDSVSAFISRQDVASVRATGAMSPVSSFSSGVSAAAASSGETGAGVKPLAEIVDPTKPFVLYNTQAGDSVSGVAQKFGISLGTLLDNNPTITDKNLIQKGQELVVPRKDGIMYKVGFGDSVDSVVKQYDNITKDAVLSYRPNGVGDGSALKAGDYLLLVGATKKPPPPPPPAPKPVPRPTGTGAPPPNSGGRFNFPLGAWQMVSDPFGSDRGGGRIHEGIDLSLFGYHHSNIFSACNGVVARTEYLTYSYGYHVIVDCGDGWTTLYAHMSDILVSPGQRVNQGTILGVSGVTGFTTGEHLHFEIRLNGAPLDPALYLGF
jgi:murein DD-endopeptidase MepM/ murein hydrolase activator NlpD